LLRLDVKVNAVEAIGGMLLIELNDGPDSLDERITVFAGLVGVGAVEQGFDTNARTMQEADEVSELALLGGFGARGDGNVDFVDALGSAEIAERFGGVRSG
jgi:hypothetical protein